MRAATLFDAVSIQTRDEVGANFTTCDAFLFPFCMCLVLDVSLAFHAMLNN